MPLLQPRKLCSILLVIATDRVCLQAARLIAEGTVEGFLPDELEALAFAVSSQILTHRGHQHPLPYADSLYRAECVGLFIAVWEHLYELRGAHTVAELASLRCPQQIQVLGPAQCECCAT